MGARRTKAAVVGSGQASLFGPVAEAYNPRIYRCAACGADACFGLGWPLVTPEQWFCPHHVPAGFLPQQRSVAA
jgi:hypothetical protein